MNEQTCRRLVRERSGEICEFCGRSRATDMHHRKARSQGGYWHPAGVLHLCHFDHMWITVHPAEAYRSGWSVRSRKDPSTTPVWIAGREWCLLTDDGDITPTRDIPEEVS